MPEVLRFFSKVTSNSPVQRKLMMEDNKQTHTTAKIDTLVLANIVAPIKHTIKFNRLRMEQYRNRHHSPSRKVSCSLFDIKYPEKKFL